MKAENHIEKAQKRDGRIVDFEQQKITDAIFKAITAAGQGDGVKSKKASERVVQILNRRFKKDEIPTVEQVQDIVEEVLILEGLVDTARAYILYREQRRKIRELGVISDESSDKIDSYLKELDWQITENANMTFSLQGLNQYVGSYVSKKYWLNKIYPKEVRDAAFNEDFHIHNLEILAPYCAGWDLYDFLRRGFGGVMGKIECNPPKHLRTALGQLVNVLYTLQGETAGANAVSNFDTLLAPFIRYDNLNYKQVKQVMQEFLYSCMVPTRVGFQTPFLNVSLDIKPPSFLAKQPVIIGGQPQNETYGDFQPEMDMFIKAFYEGLMEGDSRGRPFTFPIPTVSITKDFEWDNPNLNAMWEATAKYGINYFSNFLQSDMKPEDFRSMCCRLRLSNKELYMRGGGLFGSQPLTGSIGVVTINLPRIGYLSKTKKDFFERLGHLMDLAKESLEIKRKALENFIEKGLYPYSRHYLDGVKKLRDSYFGNHFSTIGLIGMNEALLNFLGDGVASKNGKKFALEIMDFMREKMVKYQEETGNMYNLEATPGEGTSYRQARTDREKYPDIVTAGTKEIPYYTNCVSEDTEILTNNGWEKYDKIKVGNEVLTYNMVSKELEYQQIKNIYIYEGERDMINIKSRAQDQLVTPNHMVLCESGSRKGTEYLIPAINLPKNNFMIRMGASWNIKKDNKEYSDNVLKLVAWIVTEGHFEKDNKAIRIIQLRRSRFWKEIKKILDEQKINYSILGANTDKHKDSIFRITAEDGEWIRKIVSEKNLPRELINSLSERQLNLLLYEIAKGDGVFRKHPKVIYAKPLELAGKIQEIAIKTGKRSVMGLGDGAYYVDIVNSRCKSWIMSPPKKVKYKGKVWCIEVSNHTFVARRNGKPFITGNSTHLPVNYTDDPFEALKLQDELQKKYTGGTVLHLFLGERISDPQMAKNLVKKAFEKFHLPYITLTPTFSICPSHGYLDGEHFECPKCTIKQPCEVYSRIVGYIRPIQQWNKGKKQEYKERKEYKIPASV